MDEINIIGDAEKQLQPAFRQLEETAYSNQVKVLKAFKKNRVREHFFYPSSGYGYGDVGRESLEKIYADVFQAEDALVRNGIISGTHAISACLFGVLKAGDELISISGRPYDTLAGIIGIDTRNPGTLLDKGINYLEVDFDNNNRPDFDNIRKKVSPSTRMVFIQRSRGYSLRPALTLESISAMIKAVKEVSPNTIVMVDNCYGEFTGNSEPVECGADLIAGSLIKNPGGGLAPTGGYIAGRRELIAEIAFHLTAPGLGKEMGSSLVDKRWFYQGLFLAPHIVLQALKGALLLAMIFEKMGYEVFPRWNAARSDIVQAVKMYDKEQIKHFCQIVQSCSPVDSDVFLEFSKPPGYSHQIIMAAGTFVQGSSIELSCDAPLREPYCVYMQGGLTYEHYKYTVYRLLVEMMN